MQDDQAEQVKSFLITLQKDLEGQLRRVDPEINCQEDKWERMEGGGGRTLAFKDGPIIEKGGINFSDVSGNQLPKTATQNRPELEGASFRGMGVSVVFHPDNPFIPTAHANVRYFEAQKENQPLAWWFGGGFDLTPYYPFEEDVIEWHQKAKNTCDPFGAKLYSKLKKWCDEYFYLPHRNETRGVGGLFFDDFCEDGFEKSFFGKFKIFIFRLLNIRIFHYKTISKKFKYSKKKITQKKIRFFLINSPRSRKMDRIIRFFIDLVIINFILKIFKM